MAELGDYSLIEEQDTVRLRFHDRYKENTLIFDNEAFDRKFKELIKQKRELKS